MKITRYSKLLFKLWPQLFFHQFARKIGINNPAFEQAHELFDKVERIDLFPLNGSNSRGFMIVLDGKTSLWFYQDGDHFKYDGFEMGEYEKGDVTIFDCLK
ncbi:MAG: hypothetical protein V1907_04045 [Candidatus Kerfeldbacteria bacterium]